MVINLKT